MNSENREELKRVFADTVSWIDENDELKEAVEKTKKGTEIFSSDDYPNTGRVLVTEEIIRVTNEKPFEAAKNLKKEYPGSKVAVLNFGNVFEPCGGEITGSDSREESMCRISTLYPCLKHSFVQEEFYNIHKKTGLPIGSDTLVYMNGVVVCKSDTTYPERLPRDKWFEVDVITAAAPDIHVECMMPDGTVIKGFKNAINQKPLINDAVLFGYQLKRAIHILSVAEYKKVDALVLGAFGCGEFANSPHVVANAFRIAIEAFPKVFREIRFAIYSTVTDNEVFDIFDGILFPEITENDE